LSKAGRKRGKYRISEQRRCPKCRTKSYAKLLGQFTIYSYYCKKCGHVHSNFRIVNSIELADLARDPYFGLLPIAYIAHILESSPREPLSLAEFDSLFQKKE
jgi:hypothetical protein